MCVCVIVCGNRKSCISNNVLMFCINKVRKKKKKKKAEHHIKGKPSIVFVMVGMASSMQGFTVGQALGEYASCGDHLV